MGLNFKMSNTKTAVASPYELGLWGCLIFVSGVCSLVFQVAWMREFHLLFGGRGEATAVVLAVFMGGIGFGGVYWGGKFDSTVHKSRAYGWLELSIATSTAVTPWAIDISRYLYVAMGGESSIGTIGALVFRCLCSLLVLGLPTFLMGGALPAATACINRGRESYQDRVALLYGLNTMGAVIGCWMTTFAFLESLGTRNSLWLACGANFLVGMCILICLPVASELYRPSSGDVVAGGHSPSLCISTMVLAFVFGFCFFIMEIVWNRLLGPLLGGTTYSFGLILTVALFGLGTGSLLSIFLSRRWKPAIVRVLTTGIVEALLLAAAFALGDNVPVWIAQKQASVHSEADQMLLWMVAAAIVVLPTAIISGFQLPLLVGLSGQGSLRVATHVGRVFAANTLGAIAGSLAGGLILMPLLGANGLWQATVIILVICNVGISLALAKSIRLTSLAFMFILAILSFVCICADGPTAVWRHSQIGSGMVVKPSNWLPNETQRWKNSLKRRIIWERDGVESCVAIAVTDSLSFIIDGEADGNACHDAGTQIGLGLIGPILNQSCSSALIVGLGTGESAGWLAKLDTIKSVDVVEIEPVISKMAEMCERVNCECLRNDKVHLSYGDAREFLQTNSRQFDLVVSEPSNPYRAGIATLFTREFYRSVKGRLTNNGLFVQWLQAYEVDVNDMMIVLRTLRETFPHVEVWRTETRDLMLVCKVKPSDKYDNAVVQSSLRDPHIADGMKKAWQITDLAGFAAHYVCGVKTVDLLIAETPNVINTDDRNLLEFGFAKSRGVKTAFTAGDVLKKARAIHDDVPFANAEVDVETLTLRRIAMNSLFNEIELGAHGSSSERVRSNLKAVAAYMQGDFEQVVNVFHQFNCDTECPISCRMYAHAFAEVGLLPPPSLLLALDKFNPVDSMLIQAILNWQCKRSDRVTQSLSAAFDRMSIDPWATPKLIRRILDIAASAGFEDAGTAAKLFTRLSQPLAMYRCELERRLVSFDLATCLGDEEIVQALCPFEPAVPWEEFVLEQRVLTYGRLDTMQKHQANQDLLQYRRWK